MPSTTIDVDRVLNEGGWTVYQQWLVFLTALTIVFDGFDNQLLGVALPTIMREWSVTRAAFAPVVSLGYLGMMIGGTLAGYAGDRTGRRNALLTCMALFGLATIAVTAASSVSMLGVLRLIAGVGLGGAMPNAAALAAEYVPLRQRPFAVTLAIGCVPLGATLAGMAAIVAAPNNTRQPSSALRRPMRSPAKPASVPPIIIPRYPSETTGAKAARVTPHSRMIVGSATPSSWLSKPSKTMVSAVRKTSHC